MITYLNCFIIYNIFDIRVLINNRNLSVCKDSNQHYAFHKHLLLPIISIFISQYVYCLYNLKNQRLKPSSQEEIVLASTNLTEYARLSMKTEIIFLRAVSPCYSRILASLSNENSPPCLSEL